MEIPRHWRLTAQRYRLEGSLCPICGEPTFPPRPVCPRCADLGRRVAGSAVLVLPPSIDVSDLDERIGHPITESTVR